jgi:hypothetical protein
MRESRAGSGTIEQHLNAEPYRGRHVRVRSWIRGDGLSRASMTLAVAGEYAGSLHSLRSATNGIDAPFEGSFDWKQVDRVIEVPENAERIGIYYAITPALFSGGRAAGTL